MEEDYRNLCQVFTPNKNVKELLDWCEYKSNLFGKKIMENSCGDGQILQEVVKRYIEDCLMNKMSNDQIEKGLSEDIYGIEYDKIQYEKCKKNLNNILKQYRLNNVSWKNLKNEDALLSTINNKFDYVVGNPPYIKYKSLSLEDRQYIRKKFETCQKGKFDYCYAFIESSIKSLKNKGKMAYLIPSSIFKNVFANDLREFMKPHIIKIYDYVDEHLFDRHTNDKGIERLVSSVIMVVEKNSNSKEIKYTDVNNRKKRIIEKDNLKNKWIFRNELQNGKSKKRFGEYFWAANTIATLYNEAYVIKEYNEDDNYIYPLFKGKTRGRIEKEILKDTISPKSFSNGKKEKIIFPYYYNDDNELVRYETDEFEKRFKGASEYLKNFKDALENRKADKNARWYEYGRSQALKNSNKEKILMSTVITQEVKTKVLPSNNIPYSGIYIVSISNMNLEQADKILKSKKFLKYVTAKGINTCGSSIRITSKDINEYMF